MDSVNVLLSGIDTLENRLKNTTMKKLRSKRQTDKAGCNSLLETFREVLTEKSKDHVITAVSYFNVIYLYLKVTVGTHLKLSRSCDKLCQYSKQYQCTFRS